LNIVFPFLKIFYTTLLISFLISYLYLVNNSKMKKTFFLFTTIFFLSNISYAQAPDWLWAKSAGGSYNDAAHSVAVDALGNAYLVGNFASSEIIFGSDTLSRVGSYDIFLAKYDASGYALWAKSVGGMGLDEANSVTVDALGNIYLAGTFRGRTITFDSITLTNIDSSNTTDIFLAKFATNGNVIWAKSVGGTGLDQANSVAVDALGNVNMVGYFKGDTISFDTTTFSTTLNTYGLFLVKYDANGNVLWAKSADGEGQANSVTVDASGNIYLAGDFSSAILTFDSINLTNTNGSGNSGDIFLVKYDTSGNILWAKSAGGTGEDDAYSVAVDALENTYLTGVFGSSTIIFNSTTLTNANTGNFDIFLAKYDAGGNLQWAKSGGGANQDEAFSVAVDASGNPCITGSFNSNTLSFDPTTLMNTDTNGTYDIFLTKYSSNGNVLWSLNAEGTSNDWARSVAVDTYGNIYVTGYFKSPTLISGSFNLTNSNNGSNSNDIFLAKLSNVTGISELGNSSGISVFPNPSSDYITIDIPEKATIEIINIEGQIIKSISAKGNNATIDISGLPSGMYFVTVKTGKGIEVRKFIKL
jgi:hypothetical protein